MNHMKQIARNARKTMAVCAIPDQKLVKGTKSFPTTALGMGPLLVNYSLQSSVIEVNKVKIRKKASEAWFVVVYSSNCQAHRHTITTCSYRTPPKAHPSPELAKYQVFKPLLLTLRRSLGRLERMPLTA